MTPGNLERAFINRYQGGFPLLDNPFVIVAANLGCTEYALINTIRGLLDSGLLSRFGPLYDAIKLGGGLTLAALSVPEDRFEHIAARINEYPQVAHNYRREHSLNMWFVLATESAEDIDIILNEIEQTTGLDVYNFPKQQEFYIGLWLKLDEDNQVTTISLPPAMSATMTTDARYTTDELDRRIISLTQAGLPVVDDPYQAIADIADCTSREVIQRLQNMLSKGIIRRIGAVPNHYRLGLKANGMTVWDVPDDQAMDMGRRIGQLDFVSHCYLRPRHLPVWPYNLFAMVHGHTREEVDAKAKLISDLLGGNCVAHETLMSTAVLKKTGMRLAA
jgi:DNA-binding Lrp family transcriptional regulator